MQVMDTPERRNLVIVRDSHSQRDLVAVGLLN